MRKRQLPIALLVATACPVVGSAFADTVWQGSYSADGQCFCSGEVPSSIASRIVPTPIGGQTVKQVCRQIGEGPGLIKHNGLFNHTVYKDPQCGNGPFVNNSAPRDSKCVGSLDGTYASCQSAGPEWELAAAYANPGAPAAATPEDNVGNTNTQAEEQTASSSVSKAGGITPAQQAATAAKVSQSGSPLNDASASASDSAEPSSGELIGESVTLGDERFFRARADIPAKGGAHGTRIILDGFVYLKDDGTLKTEDLYQEGDAPDLAAANAASTPVVDNVVDKKEKVADADVKETSSEPTLAAPTAQSATSPTVAKSAESAAAEKAQKARPLAELKQQQELRESRAREQLELERSARAARLEQEQQIAEQKKNSEEKILAKQRLLAEQKVLAEQRSLVEKEALVKQQQIARQKALTEKRQLGLQQAKAAREQSEPNQASSTTSATTADSVAAATDAVKPGESDPGSGAESVVLTALRLPAHTRPSSRNFAYVEALPTSYDIGGNGMMLEGSAQRLSRMHFVGKLGVTETFHEIMVGGGYHVTPASATRMTLVLLAGVEHGSFELSDETRAPGLTVTSSDSGLYLGAMSRFVVNNKFELKGGVGYSSFFKGDATIMGGGYYHVTPRLDVMSRFEIGDNDSLGIGIRYYY